MGVYFDIGYMVKSLPVLLSYVHITLGLTAAAVAGGLAASIFLAMAVSKNIPVLAHFARVYISFMRGTPILAVPSGQLEAALSCGLSEWQAYRQVVFPQAVKIAAEPVVNMVITTLKDTSLVFNVGIIDMMRKADLLGANSQRNLELYIDTAIIYVLLVLALHYGGKAVIRFIGKKSKRERAEVQVVEYC